MVKKVLYVLVLIGHNNSPLNQWKTDKDHMAISHDFRQRTKDANDSQTNYAYLLDIGCLNLP